MSTDAKICFGVAFKEDFEFPWDQKYSGDIEDWWLCEVLKYKPSIELFDETGQYKDGKHPSKETLNKYFRDRRF